MYIRKYVDITKVYKFPYYRGKNEQKKKVPTFRFFSGKARVHTHTHTQSMAFKNIKHL